MRNEIDFRRLIISAVLIGTLVFVVLPSVNAAVIMLSKNTVPPDAVYFVGDTVFYELQVSNPDPTYGCTVDIYDILPNGTWLMLANDLYLNSFGSLGDSWTTNLSMVINEEDVVNGSVINTLYVVGENGIGEPIEGWSVIGSPVASYPPEFAFAWEPVDCLNLSFSGWASDPANITNHTWDFGDSSTLGPIPGAPGTVYHFYPLCGYRLVKLSGYDNEGAYNETTEVVYVPCGPIAIVMISPSCFEPNGTLITFDGSYSYADYSPLCYNWMFSDGVSGSSDDQAITTRGVNNTIAASLTVVDDWGCMSIHTVQIDLCPYTHTDVGATVDIELSDPSDLEPYLPPETNLSNSIVITVNVTDDTLENSTDDAYTDITINVGELLDVATCEVYKEGSGFLPEVGDVKTLPTVKPPGEAKFARDEANNSIIVRLYVGDPLLAVVPSSAEDVFDTEEGTYPSISGTHNGTITPSCNISVNRLYTYPCPGTGGHTEYVKIRNSTGWNVTSTWNGYVGDWRNITFNESFVLYENETYNYTLKTGSYPQIIHESPFNATGGTIRCTSFEDANEEVHTDWIPAIRLE
jgi:hypothetical protein